MSDYYYDAVMVKPKVDVYIMGFGYGVHYLYKPFTLYFKYAID
jgi:hypothetical protein